MLIWFMRHGETDYNKNHMIQGRTDVPLNDAGIRQAKAAAAYFRSINAVFDRVYSSPLVRARLTASIAAGINVNDVIIDERIQELGFGTAEGGDIRALDEGNMRLFRAPESYIAPEGGESLAQLEIRCTDFLGMIREICIEEPEIRGLLVVTHGAALRGLVNCMKGDLFTSNWEKGVPNCSIIMAETDGHGWQADEKYVDPVRWAGENGIDAGQLRPEL